MCHPCSARKLHRMSDQTVILSSSFIVKTYRLCPMSIICVVTILATTDSRKNIHGVKQRLRSLNRFVCVFIPG
ncbi:hypothetical protein ARMSODRAFT_611358 [Armillaria solidipes]|uniref:Uncharacterized protein n=1 Tax=Armillaria solidipes TaxID=1076256 RepID=A0A2H3AX72_9AGAR|nr:hypothetical protein ARMSODRAFT_611358 [Armillaria solidipes]